MQECILACAPDILLVHRTYFTVSNQICLNYGLDVFFFFCFIKLGLSLVKDHLTGYIFGNAAPPSKKVTCPVQYKEAMNPQGQIIKKYF